MFLFASFPACAVQDIIFIFVKITYIASVVILKLSPKDNDRSSASARPEPGATASPQSFRIVRALDLRYVAFKVSIVHPWTRLGRDKRKTARIERHRENDESF